MYKNNNLKSKAEKKKGNANICWLEQAGSAGDVKMFPHTHKNSFAALK